MLLLEKFPASTNASAMRHEKDNFPFFSFPEFYESHATINHASVQTLSSNATDTTVMKHTALHQTLCLT